MPSAQAGFKSGKGGATPADLLVRLGPTLLVHIGLRSRAPAGEPPDLVRKNVKALIDTGAGGDCIDEDLAKALGLPITDEGEMSGVADDITPSSTPLGSTSRRLISFSSNPSRA